MKNKLSAAVIALLVLFAACGGGSDSPEVKPSEPKKKVVPTNLPAFNADSAYQYTAKQVAFGPRVPNTEAHVKCGDYLIAELNKYGAKVIVQAGNVTAYTGESLKFRNIVGRMQPELANRIMISCHWDTRPFLRPRCLKNPKSVLMVLWMVLQVPGLCLKLPVFSKITRRR
jgi:hypothetical protein